MKKFIFLLLIFFFKITFTNSQTLFRYDNIETRNWFGAWNNASNIGYSNSASVSNSQSTVLYGNGSGSSPNESNTYRLPNVTGLDVTKQYQFSFRLASYTLTSPSATTRGVDAPDYVSVRLSINGGSYVEELRITGNSNASWAYNSSSIFHTANGSFSGSTFNQLPLTGSATTDIYRSPPGAYPNSISNGPSTIYLNLPSGTTQVAVDILCIVNADGEEWWLDNIELWDITPIPLPVELIEFTAENGQSGNIIKWSTASEYNSSHFILQKSTTGLFENSDIANIQAAGNSNQVIDYRFIDTDVENVINYYRLVQYDFDGKFKEYHIVAVDNRGSKKVIKIIDTIGREIDEYYKGFFYIVYSDGSIEKSFKN